MSEQTLPVYRVEPPGSGQSRWRVVGPNGRVDDHASEREAQARADQLNAEIAEAREDDA